MSEDRKQKSTFKVALPRWLNTVPGLRAVRVPKFGSDALRSAFFGVGFALYCSDDLPRSQLLVWVSFLAAGLPFAAIYLFRVGQTIQSAAYRLRNLPPPNNWTWQNALTHFVATLPNLMLFLWAVVHLFKIQALWVGYAALLVWVNYFLVGCAVALRRGVDDLVRSRQQSRQSAV